MIPSSLAPHLLIAAALVLPAGAVSLAEYQFNGNYNNNLSPLPTGISSAGPITLGAGLTGTTTGTTQGVSISSNPANTLYIRSSILYSALPAEKSITSAIAAADYFSFELTIASGYTLDLSSVAANLWSSTAVSTDSYTTNAAVYYTLNGTDFTSEAGAVKISEIITSNSSSSVFTLTDNLGGNEALTGTVRFHFLFWDPANTNRDDRVTRMDNIIVNGTLTAVPEPSSTSLAALFLSLPLLRRRRGRD